MALTGLFLCLFLIVHLSANCILLLPEAHQRVLDMSQQMEQEGFCHCSFTGACEVECPEGISIANIAEMNARVILAKIFG